MEAAGMKDEAKFKEYLTALCEIHDKKISPLLVSLYWKVLEQFTDEQCIRAFKALIYETRYFPKPVEFIEAIRGKNGDRATAAWIEVLETVKRVGHYQSVRFSDPVIHAAIESMGGWVRVAGDMKADDEKWKQKEFERLYDVMSRNPRDKMPEYLPGLCEIQNATNGYDHKADVVMIGGNEQKQIGEAQ
jgi:hypothetical protein